MPVVNSRLCAAAWDVVPAGELASLLLREGGAQALPTSAYSKLPTADLLSVFKRVDVETAAEMAKYVKDPEFLEVAFKDRRKMVREALAKNSHISPVVRTGLVQALVAADGSRHAQQLAAGLLDTVGSAQQAWDDVLANPDLWLTLGENPRSTGAYRLVKYLSRQPDLSAVLSLDSRVLASFILAAFYRVSAESTAVTDEEFVRRLRLLPPSADDTFKKIAAAHATARVRRDVNLHSAEACIELFDATRNSDLLEVQLLSDAIGEYVPTRLFLEGLPHGPRNAETVLYRARELAAFGVDAELMEILIAHPEALQRMRGLGPVFPDAVERLLASPDAFVAMLDLFARVGVRSYSAEYLLVRGALKAATDEQAERILALFNRSKVVTATDQLLPLYIWEAHDREHNLRMLGLFTAMVDELEPSWTALVAAQAATEGYPVSDELVIAAVHHFCEIAGQVGQDRLEFISPVLKSSAALSTASQWHVAVTMDELAKNPTQDASASYGKVSAWRVPALVMIAHLSLFTEVEAEQVLVRACAVLAPQVLAVEASSEQLMLALPAFTQEALSSALRESLARREWSDATRVLVDAVANCSHVSDSGTLNSTTKALLTRLMELQGEAMTPSRFSVALTMLPTWPASLAELSFMLTELEG